jgi:AraC-like DNA-binding protein
LAARERTLRTSTDGRHSRQLFASELVRAGTFAVARDDPAFAGAGEIREQIELVFPLVPVAIEQEGLPPFIADPLRVVWYAPRQKFMRRAISQAGDRCLWLAFAPETIEQALAAGQRARGFGSVQDCRGVGTSSPMLAMARAGFQRMLVIDIAPSPLAIEERAMSLLDHALQGGPERLPLPRSDHERRCAWRAREVLGCRFAEALPLAMLAREAGCSAFHLARAFRRETGHSLHGFQTRLRLRAAVARLAQGDEQTGSLALDLGFCSHSHFSASFRREFGVTPTGFRHQYGLWRRPVAEPASGARF